MKSARRIPSLALAISALALAACDFTSFETFRTHAPIVTLEPPDDYPSARYGGLVAVASDGAHADWLVVSDGLGTPVALQPLHIDGAFAPTRPPSQLMCSTDTECGPMPRIGIGLAGVDGWSGATACAMTGSFASTHEVRMRCVGENGAPRLFTIAPPAGLEMAGFGLAIAAPRRHHAGETPQRDLVFVGAPAGGGHVIAASPTGTTDVTPTLNNVSAMGSALAAGRFRATDGVSEVLLAAGSTSGQVVVLHGDPRLGRAMEPVGCIVRNEPGFGLALTTADLDGDGTDEVIVGDSGESMGRSDIVRIYALADAMGGTACDGRWAARGEVSCPSVPDRGVDCAVPGGFGSALAAGDLDGDGRDEVVVGASTVTVDEATRAGAVYVLGADASAPFQLSVRSVLRDATPTTNGELGAALQVALLGAREEIVAGAPGAYAARLFLCSGIPGDRPHDNGLSEECR